MYILIKVYRHPPPLFPVCITVLWFLGRQELYRQTATVVYSRQRSYTDREKSAHAVDADSRGVLMLL